MPADLSLLEFIGYLDRRDSQFIEGWVAVKNLPALKILLEVVLDGQVIGHCMADRYREDLAAAGIGDGSCSFSFRMPESLPAARLNDVQLRISGLPSYLIPSAAAPETDMPERPTVSRFGGLWTDRTDFLDQLARKHRDGAISDVLADQLTHFVRDGYVVLKQAVPAKMIDRLNEDIERVWKHPPAGLLIETFEPDSQIRLVTPDLAWRNGRTKLLDLYTVSQAARRAIAVPAAVGFLNALFEAPPKAFQGLTFWRGSQQDMHKDTAYVKVDKNPMHLAASWLALQDIQPGTGELEYYVGSHRAPDFLFGGAAKWMLEHTGEHDKFLASLHEDARVYHHSRQRFCGQAGDILFWHADLAHGGSRIEVPDKTRQSMVTHYCPAADMPFYARNVNHPGLNEGGMAFISEYGAVT